MDDKPVQLESEHSDAIGSTEKPKAAVDSAHLELGSAASLSPEHREYLLARHGTLDLSPLPSMDPADPLNWPYWKKNLNLILIAFHAMMTSFIAAAIIPAFELLSISLDISLTEASYLTSVQIVMLGISPLFWKPISNRYGRRPVWLLSTAGSLICNIGCAESHSYATQMVCRILVAFWISPAMGISSAVVTETFFARERGTKLGIWTLMVTLGPPTGPFLMGFVAYHTGGYVWIYYILAIINGVQFILYFFFSPETLYVRSPISPLPQTSKSAFRREYLSFGKIGPDHVTFASFVQPLKLFAYPNVLIPAVAYSIIFNFSSVLLTVEIPQIFTPKYHFNAQQIGLQFLGMIIGSVVGEQLGGLGSDLWMRRGQGQKTPEYRLWISYPGFVTAIVGLAIFCVQTDKLSVYNVSPIVGIGIAAFGNQIITTVATTYAVDCHHEESANIGVFISLVRSTWSFIGPFWFPDMFDAIGLSGSAALMCSLMVVFALFPFILLQIFGERMRKKGVADEVRGNAGKENSPEI